jgi:antirestriction protein
MPKLYISCDSMYPFFTASEMRGWNEVEIEVTEEWLEEYQKISSKFLDYQEDLGLIYEGRK